MATLLAASLTFQACSESEDESPVTTNNPGASISFTIDTGASADTRALKETTEEGVGYENYIDLDDIRFFFFVTGTNYAAPLFNLKPDFKYCVSDGLYYVGCKLTSDQYNKLSGVNFSFRILVAASWALTDDKVTTIENFSKGLNEGYFCWHDNCNYSYNYGTDADGIDTYFIPSKATPIPMYGVKEYSNQTIKKNQVTDLGSINVLRAMAKVEVIWTGDKSELNSVKLTKCLNGGTCAPDNMFVETEKDPKDTHLNLPGEHSGVSGVNTKATAITDIPFQKIAKNDYLLYMPEHYNSESALGQYAAGTIGVTQMILTVGEGDAAVEHTLEFKDYSDANSTPFNILRNHHYLFNVSAPDAQLVVNYVVIPWDEKTADPIEFN
jgi:hypothetical protein